MKALNCPNCAAPFNPKQNNCEYCGSYIITSEAKQLTYNADDFPATQKIFFHEIELGSGEIPLRSGVGNLYYSITKSDGGRILLTNKRLIFCAHAININPNLYWEMQTSDIHSVDIGANFFITQRIHITDKSNKETMFVVYGGKEWVKEINQTM
ncbi:PH domain-containing protein [Metasolibacillus sp. FSL H7-0170]|uniref:PH domain-containing protein n=1 Tax=Metasolibacillus sp. FSL H7-0170 TaxID=2921431 RepID=UPI0031586ED4